MRFALEERAEHLPERQLLRLQIPSDREQILVRIPEHDARVLLHGRRRQRVAGQLAVSDIRNVKSRFIDQVVEIRNPDVNLDEIEPAGLRVLLEFDLGESFEPDLLEKGRPDLVQLGYVFLPRIDGSAEVDRILAVLLSGHPMRDFAVLVHVRVERVHMIVEARDNPLHDDFESRRMGLSDGVQQFLPVRDLEQLLAELGDERRRIGRLDDTRIMDDPIYLLQVVYVGDANRLRRRNAEVARDLLQRLLVHQLRVQALLGLRDQVVFLKLVQMSIDHFDIIIVARNQDGLRALLAGVFLKTTNEAFLVFLIIRSDQLLRTVFGMESVRILVRIIDSDRMYALLA